MDGWKYARRTHAQQLRSFLSFSDCSAMSAVSRSDYVQFSHKGEDAKLNRDIQQVFTHRFTFDLPKFKRFEKSVRSPAFRVQHTTSGLRGMLSCRFIAFQYSPQTYRKLVEFKFRKNSHDKRIISFWQPNVGSAHVFPDGHCTYKFHEWIRVKTCPCLTFRSTGINCPQHYQWLFVAGLHCAKCQSAFFFKNISVHATHFWDMRGIQVQSPAVAHLFRKLKPLANNKELQCVWVQTPRFSISASSDTCYIDVNNKYKCICAAIKKASIVMKDLLSPFIGYCNVHPLPYGPTET